MAVLVFYASVWYDGTGQAYKRGNIKNVKSILIERGGRMLAYHVVTDRPMHVEQRIVFDEEHHSGVYQCVYDM